MGPRDPHGSELKVPFLVQVPVGQDPAADSVRGLQDGHGMPGRLQQLASLADEGYILAAVEGSNPRRRGIVRCSHSQKLKLKNIYHRFVRMYIIPY
jgi:hypothetical protein